ncbi:MAG: response regulator [Vicinamibacterales bacterium]
MPVDQARVLIVDDDEDDVLLTRDLLATSVRPVYALEWAPTYEEGMQRVTTEEFDACLVDYRMGSRNGVEFIQDAVQRGVPVPFILLTGQASRDVDLAGMRAGASDFLQKGDLDAIALDRAIRYAIQHRRLEDQRIEIGMEQAARREAERANTAKDQFIALLAHELRNPMAGLSNAVALLGSPNATHETVAFARDVLQRQTATMRRLIDDLLDVARLTHGKLQLDRQPVDVVEIARRAAAAATPAAEARGHALAAQLPNATLLVDGDAVRLEQALGSLLDNAIKFTAESGHVTLQVAAADEGVTITVTDDGIGMSPPMCEQAFELFVQQRPMVGQTGGLGVGLGVARGIVDGHGGTLTATSPGPGEGATFTIRLPLLTEGPAAAGPMILIVDDNPDGADLLARYLSTQGARAEVAGDGATALALFRDRRPDAVCLDLGLPDMDGLDVLRQMRAETDRSIPFIVLSGFSREADRQRALEAGADEFFVKPADLDELSRFLMGRRRSTA